MATLARHKRIVTVTLVGASGVGKSTLCAALSDPDAPRSSREPTVPTSFFSGGTIRVDPSAGDGGAVTMGVDLRLNLWDTAGQRVFQRLALPFVRQANVLVFVYDTTDPTTMRELVEYHIPAAMGAKSDKPLVVALVGNKVDQVPAGEAACPEGSRRAGIMQEILGHAALADHRVLTAEVSALRGEGVEALFRDVAEAALEEAGLEGLRPFSTPTAAGAGAGAPPHSKTQRRLASLCCAVQ